MGYMHIKNLYADTRILQFKSLYALEKIHGTSANVQWSPKDGVTFFSGGEKHDRFVALFDADALGRAFAAKFGPDGHTAGVVIYGEAYGGRQQGMSATYGPDLKFVAFDVSTTNMNGQAHWMDVPTAATFVEEMGLEFVDWALIPATLSDIDAARDQPSTQAIRNGITKSRIREGVVLRPPIEVILSHGERLMAKHKRDEFRETATPRKVDEAKLAVQQGAQVIAEEWVTPMRMDHVIARLVAERDNKVASMDDTRVLIGLMIEDVQREAMDEVIMDKDISKAIGARTVYLLKQHLAALMKEGM